jgi:hypothetical protein
VTPHEQTMFNEANDRVKALEWRDRVLRRLNQRLEPLGPHDKIALLRKVEELL